jgi:chitodextrinase
MRNDAHFVVATDGKVNGMRSNYPHGMVGTPTYTSQNGSKLGPALNSGYSAGYSGTVFEPIDEFKGDIARMYFYFATRYENVINTWGVAYDMFDGSTDKVFTEPFLTILMTWNTQDPVSQHEIDRNNAIYARQGNRNPFIDHPEYVAQIWSTTPDTQAPTAPTNLTASNITNTTADLTWTASTDNVAVTSYAIYKDGVFLANSVSNSYNVTGLTQNTTYNFTVYAKDAAGNTSTVSNTATFTTTNIVDTQAPTAITDLSASNTTSSSTDLSWTASTDNVGVSVYDIYKDGIFLASSNTNSYNVTGLTASTSYAFTVYAKDAAGNTSTVSNTANVTTLVASSTCGTETFTNSNAPTGTYGTGSFVGDGSVTWSYVESRDEDGYVINGNGLMLRNTTSKLTSSTLSGGIGSFTCSLLKGFTGSGNRQVTLYINNTLYGTSIAWDNTNVQTFSVNNINLSGNFTLEIRNNTGKQVVIDDVSWTCYNTLSNEDFTNNLFNVYPNPSSNNTISISIKNNTEIKGVELYNTLGQLIVDIKQPKLDRNKINITNIPSGIYIIKVFNNNMYSTKRIIVE